MSFTTECEKQNRMSFLDIAIIPENKTFTISAHRKPTFSGIYAHFDHFLPSTCKFGTVYTLAYSSFRIFFKNAYPEDFINKCFKKFMDKIHVVKETTLTVEKKPLVLVLPYLDSISLQTRTKLKKSLKTFLIVVSCK